VHVHLRISRHIAQLLAALCLVSAIVVAGFVASFSPSRPLGSVLPHVVVAPAPAQGENVLSRVPQPWCGSGSGECP
jgi:hypothetical protein